MGNYEYQLNDDLWRLLTLKDAGKFEDYTVDVRHTYIDIMNETKAHLNEKGRLHVAPHSKKYIDVIKPVFKALTKIESKRAIEKIRQTQAEQRKQRSLSHSDREKQTSSSESDLRLGGYNYSIRYKRSCRKTSITASFL